MAPYAQHRSRSAVSSVPGLTAGGAAVLSVVLTTIGAAGDLVLADSLGLGFSGAFLLATAWGALRLIRRDLAAAVVIPPLVYAGVALLALQVAPAGGSGDWLTRQVLALLLSLAHGAPVLLGGTALAGVIVLVRRHRSAAVPARIRISMGIGPS
jgi:hypothetical protein